MLPWWQSILPGKQNKMVDDLLNLFDRGGLILFIIAALSTLMWALILQCYWQLFRIKKNKLPAEYESIHSTQKFIDALVNTLPLLGLLGTVMGMISTFDALSFHGNSDPRPMSSGISQALVTTMAGLVTSLSGLYSSEHITRLLGAEAGPEKTSLYHFSISPLLGLRKIIRSNKY